MKPINVVIPIVLACFFMSCSKAKLESEMPSVAQECYAGSTSRLSVKLALKADKEAQFNVTADSGWIDVSPKSGKTPTDLEVTLNPAGLSSGTHRAKLTVQSEDAEKPLGIPVTLTVKKCQLKAAVATVNLKGMVGQERLAQKVTISTEPAGSNIGWTAKYQEPWLEVIPREGKGDGEIEVIANPKGYGKVDLNDTVTIESADAEIPAKFKVFLSLSPKITCAPGEIKLQCAAGAQQALTTKIVLTPEGAKTLRYTCTSNETWMSVDKASGEASSELVLTVNPAGLKVGCHKASLVIDCPESDPITVAVTLTVGKTQLNVAPSSPITLECHAGSPDALQKRLVLSTAGGKDDKVEFTATSDVPWVKCLPESGVTPADLTVIVSPEGHAHGKYQCKVTVSSADAENVTELPITLTVKRCKLKVEPILWIQGAAGQDDIARTLTLDTDPPSHKVDWRVRWNNDTLLDVEPNSGTTPATIKVVAKTKSRPQTQVTDLLNFESDNAEVAAKTEVIVTLYEAGSLQTELNSKYRNVAIPYEKWIETVKKGLVGLIVDDGWQGLAGAKDLSKKAQADGEDVIKISIPAFEDFVAKSADKIKVLGLESDVGGLKKKVDTMKANIESYKDALDGVAKEAQSKDVAIPAEQKWWNTGVELRKYDLVWSVAEGDWTGPITWKGQTADGYGWADHRKNAEDCHDPSLPLFALIGRVSERGKPFLVGKRFFAIITDEGIGPMHMRANYQENNACRGKQDVTILVLRPPETVRRVLADAFGPLEREIGEREKALEPITREYVEGKLTDAGYQEKANDLLKKYPGYKEYVETGLAKYIEKRMKSVLDAKLRIQE